MKTSRRVIFPSGRPVKEEAKIETKYEILKEVVAKYIEQNCKEGGKQEINLDKSQKSGRVKMNKRVRSREIYVSLSDKGKGVVVMPLEMYTKIIEKHTIKDREVQWSEIEEAQKAIRSHARSLGKILRIGENEGERNVNRCYSNLASWACDPPILRAVAKTHKAPGKDGCPKSRPIVGTARGLPLHWESSYQTH